MSDDPTVSAPPAPAASTAAHVAHVAAELAASRQRTLALFNTLQSALGRDALPRYLPEASPPLWDLGRLAWLESWRVARNPGFLAGVCDATASRAQESFLPKADAWFDDRRVNHAARWHQPLPATAVLLDYARRCRERTLALLATAARRPAALSLVHQVLDDEARLHEDWLALAQTLGIWPAEAADHPAPVAAPAGEPGGIDLTPVTWARLLDFVADDGYACREWWSDEGWEWRKRLGLVRPRYLAEPAEGDGGPRRACFGRWVPIDPAQPAMHLSAHEAEAWCRWAGRRLPSEREWREAQAAISGFDWGEVWEWVAADGDGAAPRLIGASFATPARLRAAPASRTSATERNDLFSGWRSCAA